MKLELHKITRCGFYVGRNSDAPQFGHLPDWSAEFAGWVQDRPNIAGTTTFQDLDAECPRVYCDGAVTGRSGLGLILWHGVPATDKGVAYINMDAQPGQASAQEVSLDANSIPGWPSYFWLLPRQHLLVSLQPTGRVRNRSNALPACRDYLHGWLRHCSSYVERTQADGSAEGIDLEVAWRATPGEPARADVAVRFDSQPLTTPCAIDAIRERCEDIRKLVHSVQIHRSLPADRSQLAHLMQLMGFDRITPPERDRLAFRWESDWCPDPEELESLIMRNRADADSARRERQAVRFRGDSRLYWLDGGPIRDEVDLPGALEDALHWSPQQLTEAWEAAEPQVRSWLADVGF